MVVLIKLEFLGILLILGGTIFLFSSYMIAFHRIGKFRNMVSFAVPFFIVWVLFSQFHRSMIWANEIMITYEYWELFSKITVGNLISAVAAWLFLAISVVIIHRWTRDWNEKIV